jgi:hypothetical protein
LLALLLEECHATGGHLYSIQRNGRPQLVASMSVQRPTEALSHCVTEYLADADQLEDAATQLADLDALAYKDLPVLDASDGKYLPVPLRGADGSIRGLALLHGRNASAYPHMPGACAQALDATSIASSCWLQPIWRSQRHMNSSARRSRR